MTWEAEKRKEATERLKVRMIAKQVCNMIGWSFDYGQTTPRGYCMFDRHGNGIRFAPSWKTAGRIDIYGITKHAVYPTDTITVSATRHPTAIKKDIARRLIPLLKKHYKDSTAEHRAKLNRKLLIVDTARKLCRAQGRKLVRLRNHNNYPDDYQITIPIPGGTCEITMMSTYNNGEAIECRCKTRSQPEQAERIIKATRAAA